MGMMHGMASVLAAWNALGTIPPYRQQKWSSSKHGVIRCALDWQPYPLVAQICKVTKQGPGPAGACRLICLQARLNLTCSKSQ